MRKFLITEVERYNVLKDVVEQRLKLKDASELLGISYRQAIRLKKRFIQQGIEGLIRKSPHSWDLSIILCLIVKPQIKYFYFV